MDDLPQETGRAGGAIRAGIHAALAKIMPGVHLEIRNVAQREAQQAGDALMGRIRREIDDAASRALARVDQAVSSLDAKLAAIDAKLRVFDQEFDSIMELGDDAPEGDHGLPAVGAVEPMVPYESARKELDAEEQADRDGWIEDALEDINKRITAIEQTPKAMSTYSSSSDYIHTGSAEEWADILSRLSAAEICVQWIEDERAGQEGSGAQMLAEALKYAREAAAVRSES